MKKAIFFCLVLFCSINVFGQNMSLPSAAYYEYLLLPNGCGAAGGIDVPDFIFKAACDQHDIDTGTLGLARIVGDVRFFSAMAQACSATFGWNASALTGCLQIAGIYFIGVRLFGTNAYNQAQALARNLQAAKERERGMCFPSDVFVQRSGDTYYIAIDW